MLSVFKKDAITARATSRCTVRERCPRGVTSAGASVRAFGKIDGRQVTAGLDKLPKDY